MRLPARFLLTGAAVLVSASCVGDKPVSPTEVSSLSGNPALLALTTAQTVNVVIPAAGGVISVFDAYTLNFPANAVCDPNAQDTQTGYANQQWDASCTPATGDIAVQATGKWSNGRLYVDFQPSLRFVPSAKVTLSTSVLASLVQQYHAQGIRLGWAISYSPAIDAAGVADALSDPSLRTHVSGKSGKISRRIKHFSGYVIITGDGSRVPCDPNEGNPQCVWVDDEQ